MKEFVSIEILKQEELKAEELKHISGGGGLIGIAPMNLNE